MWKGAVQEHWCFYQGGGTCSPILDFKSLYSLLSDDYRIVVVEKFGYGYSDVVDEERDIQTVLSETRLALNKAGIEGPYVLCPHSMSGIEALYWAQKYPDENEAIVGLNMAVPEYYENMKISIPLMKLGQYAVDLGITRVIPELYISEVESGKYIELDCPHYVHDYEYERIRMIVWKLSCYICSTIRL